MANRHLPVRPNQDQLRRQAKELLKGVRTGEPDATAEFTQFHPRVLAPDALISIKLVEVQRALARSYGVSSWPRLMLACRMTEAIWNDDPATVKRLVLEHPRLLREDARGVKGNWGPPMSYAANVGRDAIVTMLRDLGAEDVQFAFERACLQGKLETARLLHAMGAKPMPGSVMGPCETLNGEGLSFLLELGAELCDEQGDTLAPLALLLETYSRNPSGKHQCLVALTERGTPLPDTAPMALHQGRIDLLDRHLKADPGVLNRTFSHEDIYPQTLGCHEDASLALHGTPLAGGTLLHIAVDFDELEIARWLLEKGADVNARAAVDAEGFGGHTALFGCVVSQPFRVNCRKDDTFARLLLDAGAGTNIVASLQKRLRFVEDESEHTYCEVTPLSWGQQFHNQDWVNPAVMKLLDGKS
jgi:ankyrin repeat protein